MCPGTRYPFRWCPGGDGFLFHLDDDGNERDDLVRLGRDGPVEALVENDG